MAGALTMIMGTDIPRALRKLQQGLAWTQLLPELPGCSVSGFKGSKENHVFPYSWYFSGLGVESSPTSHGVRLAGVKDELHLSPGFGV